MKRILIWIVVVMSIAIVGLLAYLLWWSPKVAQNNQPTILNSFETCVAGNPVIEIYPRGNAATLTILVQV